MKKNMPTESLQAHAKQSTAIYAPISVAAEALPLAQPLRSLAMTQKQKAFTLIELSIVLVIIGLIVGGVLVGRDLIEISKARAQISQMEQFQTAAHTFRLKYNCRAGDCDKATDFGLGPDGDGDNMLDVGANPLSGYHVGYNAIIFNNNSGIGEAQGFWVHLAGAGLVAGDYLDASGVTAAADMGVYFPKDALDSAYIIPVLINSRLFLITGIAETVANGRPSYGKNVLTTSQMRYIHNKVGNGEINIQTSVSDSLTPKSKIHPIVQMWSGIIFSHATYLYSGNVCAESDGSGGYRYAEAGMCGLAWRLDY